MPRLIDRGDAPESGPRAVSIAGTVRGMDAGRYPCGIDIDRTETRPWGEGDPTVVISGRLVGVTMYRPGSAAAPAFPDAHLIVEDAP